LDYTIGGKCLETLKTIAPNVQRVSILYNPETTPMRGKNYFRQIETAAPALAIKPTAAPVHNETEIESTISALAAKGESGLFAMPDIFITVHRALIISLAAHYRLPAAYAFRFMAAEGGLLSYGIDPNEQYQHAPSYVDRILRGAKPDDLPVQQPTKFELVINLKTAKALGLTVPPSLLARADEVIE
jgi:ABC-type uncharacterized transport system substrate-binding protein